MGTRSGALSHIAELLGMFAPQGEMLLVSDGSLRFTPTVFLDVVDGGNGFPARLCRSHTAGGRVGSAAAGTQISSESEAGSPSHWLQASSSQSCRTVVVFHSSFAPPPRLTGSTVYFCNGLKLIAATVLLVTRLSDNLVIGCVENVTLLLFCFSPLSIETFFFCLSLCVSNH